MAVSIAGVVFEGEPYDAHTWSGCSAFFFRALAERGILRAAVSGRVSRAQALLLRAVSVHPDLARWKFREGVNVLRRKMRTRDALHKLAALESGSYDTILQIGAFYDLTGQRGKRVASYNDANLISMVKAYPERAGARSAVTRDAMRYEASLHRKSDVIFTMSRWAADTFVRDVGVSAAKVEPIGAGINLPAQPDTSTKQYDGANILFVGRDFVRKGGYALLEAFARVRGEIPHATLTLVGASGLDRLPPGVESLGFASARTEHGRQSLRAAYERASVFTLPSHYEPFGISILEAQANALPCVGTDVGAMPELIEGAGTIVPRDDSSALADALIALLKDPAACRELGRSGQNRQRTYYTWGSVAERLEQRLELVR